MLWPLILPFQITATTLLTIYAAMILAAPGIRLNRLRVFLYGLAVLPLAFIPSCIAVKSVVDPIRFGVFTYPDFESVEDFRVERYLPEAATDITVDKHVGGNGYRGRFTISKSSLDAWLDGVWDRQGQRSVVARREDTRGPFNIEEFNRWFGKFGWTPPDDLQEHQGPIAGNGATFVIWYSESEQTAYEWGAYW